MAGAGAGTCQIVVTTPMELLKIQRQMAKGKGMRRRFLSKSLRKQTFNFLDPTQSLTSRQLALQLYREKGIRGLYKGVGATFTRDVVFSMMYFPLFAYFNDKVDQKKTPLDSIEIFFSLIGQNTRK